ncbi:MAG: glycosyltransferase [Chitinophagaceae bacterium]|nr:glycosyltransferase [Chitinophagaceae bacterium]
MNQIVSVIVPCFNQAEYLPDALQSVFEQTYTDWECIIINDGSKDNTTKITREWCNRDSRFRLIDQDNAGRSAARNAGMAVSNGKFILPLDADDKIGKGYMEAALKVFHSDMEVAIVYSKADYFGNKGGEWKLPEYKFENLLFCNSIFSSAVFKKELVQKFGGYDTKLDAYEDWELWLRFLKNGGKVVQLPQCYFYYRQWGNSTMDNLQSGSSKEAWYKNYIFKKHIDIYENFCGDLMKTVEEKFVLEKKLEDQKTAFYSSSKYRLGNFLSKPFKIFSRK